MKEKIKNILLVLALIVMIPFYLLYLGYYKLTGKPFPKSKDPDDIDYDDWALNNKK